MSEEKVEKKVESSQAVPQNKGEKKKSGGIFSFVAIILFCLLALAVISVFLNNQKLHKQIVDIERKVVILQDGDQKIGSRVLALEDEFVVLGLKKRLAKLKTSVKSLLDLQGLLADNQEIAGKVKDLVEELADEEQKLEREIAGTNLKKFQASRPCQQPCQQPCYQRCPESVVIMHPPLTPAAPPATALEQAVSAHVKEHSASSAAASTESHATPVASPKTVENPDSWWYRFINLRLFGN
ncbi:MAG: hypothetical protein JXR80_01285 [Deltaproteobacteria bacterium]|nr:hypothetical protein [Deltaproteobacteria bacterium]